MTTADLRSLQPGDMVARRGYSMIFVVTGNYGDRITAVTTADITNPIEWDVVRQAALPRPPTIKP